MVSLLGLASQGEVPRLYQGKRGGKMGNTGMIVNFPITKKDVIVNSGNTSRRARECFTKGKSPRQSLSLRSQQDQQDGLSLRESRRIRSASRPRRLPPRRRIPRPLPQHHRLPLHKIPRQPRFALCQPPLPLRRAEIFPLRQDSHARTGRPEQLYRQPRQTPG